MKTYEAQVKYIDIGYFPGNIYFDYGARLASNFPILEEVHFEKVMRISNSSRLFQNCPMLKTVYFGDESNRREGVADFSGFGHEHDNLTKTFTDAFLNCASIKEVILPTNASVHTKFTALTNTFNGCTALESVSISSTVTTIGANSFASCTSLESVTLPASLATIEADAFSGCSALKDVYIAEGASVPSVVLESFPDNEELLIHCSDLDTAIAFNRQLSVLGYTNVKAVDPQGNSTEIVTQEIWIEGQDTPDDTSDDILVGTMTFDRGTGKLIIQSAGYALLYPSQYNSVSNINKQQTEVNDFITLYEDEIVYMEVLGFDRILCESGGRLFKNLPYLKEVHLSAGTRISHGFAGLFMNCTNLDTLWFGDEENKQVGVINFTGFGHAHDNYDAATFYNMFQNCTSIKKVIFPDTPAAYVKFTTTTGTFDGCTSLESVTLPSTVTTIGERTFKDCTALKEYIVPTGVTSIASSAFENCSGLTYIQFNAAVTIAEGAFTGVGGTEEALLTIQTPNSEVAGSIETQAEAAGFKNYQILDYYIYSEDIVSKATGEVIGSMKLYSNTGLLIIDAEGETLYPCADWASSNKTNHELREFVTAYKDLIKIVDINCDAMLPQWQYVFLQNLPELTEVHFSRGMRLAPSGSIAMTASGKASESSYGFFYNCPKLKTVWFGSDENRIEGVANLTGFGFYNDRNTYNGFTFRLFKNCSSLEAVILPDLLYMTNLYETFYGCTSLKSVTIPKQFGIIGSTDTDEYEPHGVTYLGGGTFEGCTALKEVIFVTDVDPIEATVDGADITAIGSNAFKGCTSLTKIVLPDTVTSIAQNAFEGCTSLKYINIPVGVSEIPASAFKGCTSLKDITIPAYVTSIGENAFEGCTALKNVNIEGSGVTFGADAFKGCSDVKVFCSENDLDNITAVVGEYGEAVALDTSAMKFSGFSVRVVDHNGLRSFFSFDESANEGSGFTLVEYGTLAAQSSVYDSYEESIGGERSIFSIEDGVVSTADDKLVKVAIYNKNNGYGDAKYTKDGTTTSFTVTVTNFDLEKAQHTAALTMVGYQIWEKDGNFYVEFTRASNVNYREVSLYKVTMGMLENGKILAENGENPVWKTIEATSLKKLDSNIEGYLMPDAFSDGKYVGLYVSDKASELKEYGTTAEERLSLTSVICGENVTNDLPFLNNTWANHVDEQLAKVPEGKSFIFITDTHDNHVLYSHVLAEYARQKLDIDTIITGGDVIENGATLEEADTKLNYVVDTQFSVWGDSWLYAQGNHDANFTASAKGREYHEYLLPDTNIIEATVDKMTANIVYDQKSIDIAANDVVYTAVGDYTAEEMREQGIAAMKKHYHYDDTERHIRYIIVDTGDNGLSQMYTFGGASYSRMLWVQLPWLIETLESTPADYDVVIAGHMFDHDEASAWGGVIPFFTILSAYQEGGVGSVTVPVEDANMMKWYDEDLTLDYDFTGHEDSTIFTMGGHWHLDDSALNGVVDGEYTHSDYSDDNALLDTNGVLSIFTLTDCVQQVTDVLERGTDGENAFDIVTITDDGRIVCTRIGAGESREFIYQ